MRGWTKVAIAALVAAPMTAAAQGACPDGRPRTGDVGIRALACTHAEGCDLVATPVAGCGPTALTVTSR